MKNSCLSFYSPYEAKCYKIKKINNYNFDIKIY